MATTQHYLWAAGHFLLLLSSFRYLLAWITLKTVSAWWYKASFTGAIISYAIVCQKSLGTPQPNLAYVKRALLDENVQYFLIAFFWWSSKPISITLLPYMIFSTFHALTFIRTTLMPQFLPSSPPATAGGPPQPHPVAKRVQVWVKNNYDTAMKVVAYTELVILARITLGALLFQNSLLAPLLYAHFLRQRYYQSAFTREACAATTVRIDGLLQHPSVPPVARTGWESVKGVLGRWVGAVLAPAAGAGAGAGAGGARR